MAGWGNTKAMGANSNGPRFDEQVDVLQFPPGKWVTIRFIGPLHTTAWTYLNVQKKDGSVSGGFPKICLDYDPAKQEFVKEICPYRAGGLRMGQRFFSNVIVRSEQKRPGSSDRTEAESVSQKMLGEKWHIKEMGSDSWTPVKVFSFPTSVFNDIMDIVEASGGDIEVNGVENGFDIKVKSDPKAKAVADKWKVQKGDNNSLSKKEMKYLIYKLDVSSLNPESLETAKKEWSSLKTRLMVRNEAGKFEPYKASSSADDSDLEKGKKKVKRKELSLDSDDEKASKKSSKSSKDKSSKSSKDKKSSKEKASKPSKSDSKKSESKSSKKSSKDSKVKDKKRKKSIDIDSIPF